MNLAQEKKRYSRLGWFLFLISLVLMLAIAEIAVRLIGHVDADGNFYFRELKVRPYRIPKQHIQDILDRYRTSESAIQYDPFLGWRPRPGSRSANGLYAYSQDGIRADSPDRLFSKKQEPGTLRIALFGDSYTHADDVSFQESWGYLLEEELKRQGINAQVLNFGVPGYGMDQAFLRWEREGMAFAPDIVLFGLVSEDIGRNVNLFRPMSMSATGLVFFKPRYIRQNGKLILINSPTPSPDQIGPVLEHIGSWDLAPYEYWLDYADYQQKIWHHSRFLSLLMDFYSYHYRDVIRSAPIKEAPIDVSVMIVHLFKNSVEAEGAEFFTVTLPTMYELGRFLRQGTTEDFLTPFAAAADMIHTEGDLAEALKRLSLKELFIPHYSAAGNSIIARTVAEYLRQKSHKVTESQSHRPQRIPFP